MAPSRTRRRRWRPSARAARSATTPRRAAPGTGLSGGQPAGAEHENGFGEQGYGGPLPPVGDDAHRYVFRLYALAEPFAAPDPADADAVRGWLDDHALATGTTTALDAR